ncbi:MAG: SEL1-like repeat protein [Clostridiales bacterium]|nr:SEL1-like repeat protein [Clostridiales bacterium]
MKKLIVNVTAIVLILSFGLSSCSAPGKSENKDDKGSTVTEEETSEETSESSTESESVPGTEVTTTETSVVETTTEPTTEATTTETTANPIEPYAGTYILAAAQFSEEFLGADNAWRTNYTFKVNEYPGAPESSMALNADGSGKLTIKKGDQIAEADLSWGMSGTDISVSSAQIILSGTLADSMWTVILPDGMFYYVPEGAELSGIKTTTVDKALISEGNSYYYGTAESGCDLKKAESFYKVLADMDNPYGWYALGRIYGSNKMLDTEHYKKAIEYYKKAIDKNYALGYLGMGYLYFKGSEYSTGVKQDLAKAHEYFQKAYDAGRLEGALALGMLYYNGSIDGMDGPDGQKAIEYYSEAAASDNSHIRGWANEYLGDLYLYGAGSVPADVSKAFECYDKAAQDGYAAAYGDLGYCYLEGVGVTKDIAKALSYFEEGAKRGNGYSYCNLASMYKDGNGVETDYDKAVQLFKKAADHGYSYAVERLGEIYYYGNAGQEQDYDKAFKYYRIAYKENSARACGQLAYMYYNGLGTKKSKKENYNFAKLGDERGDLYSKYMLGFCYAYGYGTKKNYKKALDCFATYIKNSNNEKLVKDSRKVLKDLVKYKHLTQKQVDKALK